MTEPSQLPNAKKKAEGVVFAVDAMEGMLVFGPAGGWNNPAYGLNAIQIGHLIGASRPLFESAAEASNADDLISMGMGVLDNPVGPKDVGPFMSYLSQAQAQQLAACAGV